MNQLYLGIIINTLSFGYIALLNSEGEGKLFKKIHKVFKFGRPVVAIWLTIIYYGSFIIILLAPGGFVRNIIIAVLMQFIINHIVWGIILGTIAGRMLKAEIKKKPSKAYSFRGYTQICLKCDEEYLNKEKIETCPKCSHTLDLEYEQFSVSTDSARINQYQCDECMIMFNSPDQVEKCFRCNKPVIEIGTMHISYARESIFKLLWRKIFGRF